MRHLILLSVLLVALPAVFQIWYGRKAISGRGGLPFGLVCLISVAAQFALTFFGFRLTLYSLMARGFQCGMPAVGILTISGVFFAILFVTMGIQLYLKIVRRSMIWCMTW